MKVLITGIAGFAGSHLAEFYAGMNNVDLFGIELPDNSCDSLSAIAERIHIAKADIKDFSAVKTELERIKPDRVFHLAALCSVSSSWKLARDIYSVNVFGQVNLFESIRLLGLKCRIHIACSSDEYGVSSPEELPIKESHPLRPLSPYAVSKVTQDLMGYQYHQNFGLHIIRTRSFNHIGPRQSAQYVASSFAKQIAEIEAYKLDPVIMVGNLSSKRDFTDVRDVVRAYYLALEKCPPGNVYNIASGKDVAVQEILDILVGLSNKSIEVKQDPDRLRPSDVSLQRGDATKFRQLTNWQPEIPLARSLEDLLNWWRNRV